MSFTPELISEGLLILLERRRFFVVHVELKQFQVYTHRYDQNSIGCGKFTARNAIGRLRFILRN